MSTLDLNPAAGAQHAQAKTSAQSTTIEASEWRFVAFVAIALLAVTTLPYLYAVLSAPPDRHFMGMMLDVPDHLQYFSWLRELSQGPLAANKLTPEANPPVFFNLLWWGLGRLDQATGLGAAGVFQVLRWVAAPLLLIFVYRLAALFFTAVFWRKVALLFVVLGSGLGWVLILLKYTVMNGTLIWPLDVFVAEGNTFLSTMGYPHFVAAMLYIVIFDIMLRHARTHPWRASLAAGLVALFLGWQHAYDLIIIWGVLGVWVALLCLRDRRFHWPLVGGLAVIGLISVWPALYSVLLTSWSPIWKEVLAQFDNAGVFTPPPWRLPVLLGIPLIVATVQALREQPWKPSRLRAMDDATLFLHGWFWISFVLVYLPVDYQIHMLNGWQIPISFFVTRALLTWIVPAAQKRWTVSPVVAIAALLCVVALTNVYLFAWRFFDLGRHTMPYYLTTDEVAALNWLEENVAPDDVVLSALDFGQYVPAETGAHAFLAHWAQTVDFHAKEQAVRDFYAQPEGEAEGAAANAARRALIDEYGVDWVVSGPSEQALGAFDPTTLRALREAWSSPTLRIFAPIPAGGGD